MRILVLLRQRRDLLRERRSIAPTGFAPVNVTSSSKDACTSMKCRMTTLSRLSASVLFLLGMLQHIQGKLVSGDMAECMAPAVTPPSHS